MKNIKLKIAGMLLLVIFTLTTGCMGDIDDETSAFIDSCNATPGCKYKVWSEECVCDKSNDYIPAP